MDKISQYWYLGVLLLVALIMSPDMIIKTLTVIGSNSKWAVEFDNSHETLSPVDRFMSLGSRLIPFILLGIILVIVSRTHFRDFIYPLFLGGLSGIIAIIFWASWAILRSHSSGAHIASTGTLALMFVPFLGVPAGAIGAIFAGMIYIPFRNIIQRRTKRSAERNGAE